MRLSPLPVVFALVGFSCAFSAHAADKTEPPPAPETADSLYNQGNDAYDHGDYALAFELYSGAFRLRKSYDIARNLGLAELKLEHFKDACEHLAYSLSLYPSNRADTKKQVVEWFEQATAQVGKLRLQVSPESAECRVAGAAVSREARQEDIIVDPGEVKIECTATGYASQNRVLTFKRGAHLQEKITLEAEKEAGPSGPTPAGSIGPRTTLLWIGSAATAISLGVGATTGVLSLVKAGEADGLLSDIKTETMRPSPCAASPDVRCAELLALRREQDAFGNIAFWTLVAGGAVGAGTLTYMLVTRLNPGPSNEPSRKSGSGAGLSLVALPVIAPGAGFVTVSGSF